MYLTSDLHAWHKKVLEFCPKTRPWNSMEEMHDALVAEWNAKATKPGVKMYHLGDFSFGTPEQTEEFVSRLQGDIVFINGNHERTKTKEVLAKYGEVCDYKVVKYSGKKFVLFHFPILEWDSKHHGSILCYGHIHGKKIPDSYGMGKSLDVGWDNLQKIIHFDEVIEMMQDKPVGFCSHLES